MWDGFNKRKFPRLNLKCEIYVHSSPAAPAVKTVTENLGVGGVCFILDQPLERFSRCKIRLELDPKIPLIEGLGKVVWTIPVGDASSSKKRFDTGVEFQDLKAGDRELISTFIESRLPKGFKQINQ